MFVLMTVITFRQTMMMCMINAMPEASHTPSLSYSASMTVNIRASSFEHSHARYMVSVFITVLEYYDSRENVKIFKQ